MSFQPRALIGGHLAGFRLDEIVGEGRTAVVYRGESLVDPEIVRAIKVIRPELAAGAGAGAETARRFAVEARFLERLAHPNVVRFYGARSDQNLLVMELELLAGSSLSDLVGSHGFSPEIVSEWFIQAGDGVAAAHSLGVVHRDLKPHNLFLTTRRQVKVLDFGVAKALAPGEAQPSAALTVVGTTVGTAAYIAPEVWGGGVPSPASDVYALGLSMIEILTGKHPFQSEDEKPLSTPQLVIKHLQTGVPPLRMLRPGASEELENVLKQATAKAPSDRFKTALAFANALRVLIGQYPKPPSVIAQFIEAPPPPRVLSQPPPVTAPPVALEAPRPPPPTDAPPAPAASPPAPKPALPEPSIPVDVTLSQIEEIAPIRPPAPQAMPPSVAPTKSVAPSTPPPRISAGVASTNFDIPSIRGAPLLSGPTDLATTNFALPSFGRPSAPAPLKRRVIEEVEPTPPTSKAGWVLGSLVIVGLMTGGILYVLGPHSGKNDKGADGGGANPWVKIHPPSSPVRLGHDQRQPGSAGFSPQRGITSPRDAYSIQQHEVTWGEIEPFMTKTTPNFAVPTWVPEDHARLPVTGISWETAQAYCRSLGGSLPTEEQWEFAARGQERRPNPWGNETVDLARTHVYSGSGAVHQVMTSDQDRTPGNADRALYDLAGNALEWTLDLYRDDDPNQNEDWVQEGGRTFRAIRGLPPNEAQPTHLPRASAVYRSAFCASGPCPSDAAEHLHFIGFRCVIPVD